MPEFRMIDTNGIKVRAAIEGAGPLVVMVHGFPESWYSWRHQMKPIADAGFTACAIDVRGYGGSEKPQAVEAYAMKEMTADVAGVIDALSPDKPAVLMGHDWGAPIVWHTAVLHPSKVRAVAGLSVPYFERPPAPLNHIFKMMYRDQGKFFYMDYFQAEGVAEAEFEADVRGALRRLYFASSANSDGRWGNLNKPAGEPMLKGLDDPAQFPPWLSDADIDYYVKEFEKSGFRGPINRYRNFERDFAMMGGVEDRRIHQPALFVAGAQDMVLKMFGDGDIAAMTDRMKEMIPNLQGVRLIPNCGHWTQQETPAETTPILVDWLKAL
ncbi:MAG: alpha/beta hydrolase [Hyphomonadaceae bacterium JAD_PAG50586_4]|nr:MAG: alpha/beta hydrolase [Hyphomonadaceae bacterium JAD_PAG50586_4]